MAEFYQCRFTIIEPAGLAHCIFIMGKQCHSGQKIFEQSKTFSLNQSAPFPTKCQSWFLWEQSFYSGQSVFNTEWKNTHPMDLKKEFTTLFLFYDQCSGFYRFDSFIFYFLIFFGLKTSIQSFFIWKLYHYNSLWISIGM